LPENLKKPLFPPICFLSDPYIYAFFCIYSDYILGPTKK
jgi:hypothetical protein